MGSLLLGTEDQQNRYDAMSGYTPDDNQPNQYLNTDTGQMVNYNQQTGEGPYPISQQFNNAPQQGNISSPTGGLQDLLSKPSPLQNNPQGMAGLLMVGGMPYNKALELATHMSAQQASSGSNIQKQQAIQMLGKTKDPNQIQQILYSGLFSPGEIESFTKLNGSNTDLINGANGLKYTQTKDPLTGEVALKLVPGQVEKPAITPAEARINNNKLTKLAEDANAAERENRYLDDADKYFAKFDKAQGTGTLTGAGSFITRNAPKQLDNALLSKEGQTAKQEIDKISGLIFQNRVIGAGSNATDAFKEQVKKSLPTVELTPEARQELIETKRRENMAVLTRSKFLSEWYKQNSKDITGAEDAYQSYIGSSDLLDKSGNVNKQLLKDIPKVVTEFIGTSSQPLKDNRVPMGSGPMSDNVDAMYANPNGAGGTQGSAPMVAPQQGSAAPAQNNAQQLQAWAQEAINAGRDPKAVQAKLAELLRGNNGQ